MTVVFDERLTGRSEAEPVEESVLFISRDDDKRIFHGQAITRVFDRVQQALEDKPVIRGFVRMVQSAMSHEATEMAHDVEIVLCQNRLSVSQGFVELLGAD